MAKKYSKKKDASKKTPSKKPAELSPGYRTTDFFKSKNFGGGKPPTPKFNPAQFKVQHKG